MSFSKWMNSRVKKLNWMDVGFIKISAAAFVLMVAKLWSPLLGLAWYWYLMIFIAAAIKPLSKYLGK